MQTIPTSKSYRGRGRNSWTTTLIPCGRPREPVLSRALRCRKDLRARRSRPRWSSQCWGVRFRAPHRHQPARASRRRPRRALGVSGFMDNRSTTLLRACTADPTRPPRPRRRYPYRPVRGAFLRFEEQMDRRSVCGSSDQSSLPTTPPRCISIFFRYRRSCGCKQPSSRRRYWATRC